MQTDQSSIRNSFFHTIKCECSRYLEDSKGYPLYKLLPSNYDSIHRVKVRRQKRLDITTQMFNQAFGQQYSNFRNRAVFAYPTIQLESGEKQNYYIFPTDKYSFLYSKEVTHSDSNYMEVFDTLVETFADEAMVLVTDLLKYNYSNNLLIEGIISNSEIILYNVPYFYAVRVEDHPRYQDLLNQIYTEKT